MSVRVLLVLEDPTYDRYIVEPLLKRLLSDIGRSNARVDVLIDPRMGGVAQALDSATWRHLQTKYQIIDLFVVIVDRDCVDGRDQQISRLQAQVRSDGGKLVGELAIEEIEVWLLAGYAKELKKELKARWGSVRADCHPKERYFDPFLLQRGHRGVGGGRLELMKKTLRNLPGLRQKCPEVCQLQKAIREALGARARR